MNEKMTESAKIVIERCVDLKEDETALIIYDETTKEIAEALFKEAATKADAVMMKIKPTGEHGKEPPKLVADAMKKADVVIAPTKYSLTHTKARANASKKGARVVTMPGITNSMFERIINIDYGMMAKEIAKISEQMRKAKRIRVTTTSGCDFSFENKGERVVDDDTGIFARKGAYGNLPAGEVFVAPLEKTCSGTIVIDSMESMCKPKTKLFVVKGTVREIEGDDAFKKKVWKTKKARGIAEFGIGTNPKATVTGNTLEDEKVRGTCHIALGSNFDFGGKLRSEVHWDAVIFAPTIWFDDDKIMDNGVLLL
ncbi:MAG: aminopeptidase [archaeon]